ncbi:valine--tRNA ligase [Candidatus Woesearchaeota archaeon]|nr:valine--tRNA ligase [Candidatus Woesearchaeota archaeon]
MEIPKRYAPAESEKKWIAYWEDKKVNKFILKSQKPVYSIDTPPPYASADHLHVGHGMHYSQFEFIARYKKMRGFNVFFPMGYDDNGLPTERYVEKKHKVDKSKITRKDFIKLCLEETEKTGKTYHDLFSDLGFSIDWDLLYHTIGDRAMKTSQRSFLTLFKNKRLEHIDQPTMWCTTCQTTIAQAELSNVDLKSHFSDIKFGSVDGQDLIISTTRPEMIPACVALFHHPDDKRYSKLKGKTAKVPLFNYEVPILSDESVDLEKGTGLMMVCTFGDKEDVEKWKKYELPMRVVFTENGYMNELAGKYAGMKSKDARKEILQDLKHAELIVAQKDIVHAVNVHERCDTEIEFMKKKQWQIKVLDMKEELMKLADDINWYPEHMKVRYVHWVKNLQWNWGISRQRYYGVPFPVWYCEECGEVLLPAEKDLPVDPREETYKGKCKCGSQKIIPEMDVMDTWMTSSNTPDINAAWKKELGAEFLPMSLRPQAHDIIRTWAFYTIVKSYFEREDIPWKDIMISGHGQDPLGQKMSKSKGNFVVAQDMIKKYSADAFRFWAATATLGEDLPFQEKDLVTGQKLVTKLFNASKFALMHLEDQDPKEQAFVGKMEAFDEWLLSKLNTLIRDATAYFDKYEYSRSRHMTDNFFWLTLCDNYLELVKDRFYNPEARGLTARKSGQFALREALGAVLKLYAPIMPFITEEIYSWKFAGEEEKDSIHNSDWPTFDEGLIKPEIEKSGDCAVAVLAEVRKYKSQEQLSMKAELSKVTITSKEDISGFLGDLKAATSAKEIELKKGDELKVEIKK